MDGFLNPPFLGSSRAEDSGDTNPKLPSDPFPDWLVGPPPMTCSETVVGEKRMEKNIPQELKGTYFLLKVEGFEGILNHPKCQEFCKTQKFP